AVFRRLAATADVVIENFRPGTLEKWGVGPGDLDPKLVVVRVSSFGQDGPYSPRPGLDRIGIGYGGLLHLTGYPERPPVRVGVTISDYLTGLFAAQAAVGALYARDAKRAGKGAVIDAALYGAALRILEWTIPAYDRLGIVRNREGNRLANSAPLDNYPTADGKFVCIVAGSDANFARLCKAMDRPDLLDDRRFARLWIESRLAGGRSGPHRLRAELRLKGIDPAIIEETLGAVLPAQAEAQLAAEAADRYLARRQSLPAEVRVRRLMGLLQRRGFSTGVIAPILRETARRAGARGNAGLLRRRRRREAVDTP
ncbi:MAG: RecX family transcriptional regulator, partial [bacterium]